MSEVKTKVCYRCKEPKPIGEFGRNRYYEKRGLCDGINVYCKPCVCANENQRREHIRRNHPKPKKIVIAKRKLSSSERVLVAISEGYRTRESIEERTRLHEDRVADALARLAFIHSAIRIVRVGEEREFHLAA